MVLIDFATTWKCFMFHPRVVVFAVIFQAHTGNSYIFLVYLKKNSDTGNHDCVGIKSYRYKQTQTYQNPPYTLNTPYITYIPHQFIYPTLSIHLPHTIVLYIHHLEVHHLHTHPKQHTYHFPIYYNTSYPTTTVYITHTIQKPHTYTHTHTHTHTTIS